MKHGVVTILAAMLMAACGGNVRTADAVRYDLGDPVGAGSPPPVALGALEVQAASWLAGPAMHYRLAYAEPLRRQNYAESRWAAAPADLLDTYLKRRLVFAQAPGGAGCRLQLALDEFEQRFDDARNSHQVLALRATLTPRSGQEPLARRALQVRKPAVSADARGSAAAARDAAQALADELGTWLAELAREKPVIIERCRT